MKKSSGILAYSYHKSEIKVFIAHPGGPYFKNKNAGVWSIPKGEFEAEDPKGCAIREFVEETDLEPPKNLIYLGEVRYRSGKKIVYCWTGELEYKEEVAIRSNTFDMEWPPHSGTTKSFSEIDRGLFASLDEARKMLHKDQTVFLDRLEKILRSNF